MHAAWYPPADRSQDRSQFSGITMPRISKLLLHSTESAGWPAYPSFAPQFTFDPWKHLWRQHMPLPRSASTLADPSWTAIKENRDDVVQVEIVGYCDPQRWPTYGKNVEKMDDKAISMLGEFLAWLHAEWEVPITSTVTWMSYPKSYGLNASQRLSVTGFDKYTGVLGHQHACGNAHGDPGRINISGILAAAEGEAMPSIEEIRQVIREELVRPEYLQAAADEFLNRDGQIENTFTGNPDNEFVAIKTALRELGKRTTPTV